MDWIEQKNISEALRDAPWRMEDVLRPGEAKIANENWTPPIYLYQFFFSIPRAVSYLNSCNWISRQAGVSINRSLLYSSLIQYVVHRPKRLQTNEIIDDLARWMPMSTWIDEPCYWSLQRSSVTKSLYLCYSTGSTMTRSIHYITWYSMYCVVRDNHQEMDTKLSWLKLRY